MSNLGALTVWKMCPFFKGLGYASITITWLCCTYYNVIILYTIFFLCASFTNEVPWATCNNTWNTPNCFTRDSFEDCTLNDTGSCNRTSANGTGELMLPSREYWENYVLKISNGIEDLGEIRWQLCLCYLLAWIIVYVCLIRGVKSSGKVVYVTATFPYLVLVILLVRGVTLPGAMDGIRFYIVPKFESLADPKVWGDAAVQIFYSLGPAWGGLITMASYNRFHNNCYRDAILVACCNCGTSVFAGFVVFSVIGFMAHETGQPIEKVAASGPGLAFVAYPEGISRMPVAPLWAILFFIMLLTLGLDSQFTMIETVITAFVDENPSFFRPKKHWLGLGVCIVTFLVGLPCVTEGGQYVLTLMDWYIGVISLMIIGFFEPVVISYIYGFRRFSTDISLMLGFKPNYYWLACWTCLTPATLLFIIIFSCINYVPVYYGSYVYPKWAEGVGWGLAAISVQFIPLIMIITLCREIKTFENLKKFLTGVTTREVFRQVLLPPEDWGPAVGNDGLVDGLEPLEGYHEKDIAMKQTKDYPNPIFDKDTKLDE